jgi:hypothetical protein
MLSRLLAISAALACTSAAADEAARVKVDDVRLLLVAAIDSPSGSARGVLTGETAKLITSRFGASGPILVDVITERRYAQPGCSRLKVTFSQEGVLLPQAAAPLKQTVDIGLNYCRTGEPPRTHS